MKELKNYIIEGMLDDAIDIENVADNTAESIKFWQTAKLFNLFNIDQFNTRYQLKDAEVKSGDYFIRHGSYHSIYKSIEDNNVLYTTYPKKNKFEIHTIKSKIVMISGIKIPDIDKYYKYFGFNPSGDFKKDMGDFGSHLKELYKKRCPATKDILGQNLKIGDYGIFFDVFEGYQLCRIKEFENNHKIVEYIKNNKLVEFEVVDKFFKIKDLKEFAKTFMPY